MEKTATELFNEYDELEKQSKIDEQLLLDADQEILIIQKEILKLQLIKKDKEIARGPLALKVRIQSRGLSTLKNKGYRAQHSGL